MQNGTKRKPKSTLIDLGPVIAYIAVFAWARRTYDPDTALYIGACVFAVTITLAVIYSFLKYKKVSTLLWVSAIIVTGSAAITIGFKNPTVFKMKPTAIHLLFGGTILGSLALGKNVFRSLMGEYYKLPDTTWRTLALRWGIFFLFLAGLNEFVWRNFSTDFWTYFKLWGMFPITLIFTFANVPLLLKHTGPEGMPKQD